MREKPYNIQNTFLIRIVVNASFKHVMERRGH